MGKKKTTEKVEKPAVADDLDKEIAADLAMLDQDIAKTPAPAAVPTPAPATPAPAAASPSPQEKSAETAAPVEDDFASGLDDLPDDLVEEPPAPDTPVPPAAAPAPVTPPAAVPAPAPEPATPAPAAPASTPAPTPAETKPVEEAPAEEEGGEELPEEEAKPEKSIDDKTKARNVVEAALFVAGRPISLEELNIKTEIKKKELEDILKDLMMEYMERPSSLEIVQIADKYSLQIKPEYTQDVKKFAAGGLIPEAVLKTLTIIALKQPMMKSMLIKIRGSGAYDHVKFLLDRGFIEQSKKSRSQELLTTDLFSDTFGLSRNMETLKKQLIAQLGIKSDEKSE